MCRNIKPLFHFDPPASDEAVRAAALQYVRKISGYNAPSQVNQAAFDAAVEAVAAATRELLASLSTGAPVRSRAAAEARAKERAARRYARAEPAEYPPSQNRDNQPTE